MVDKGKLGENRGRKTIGPVKWQPVSEDMTEETAAIFLCNLEICGKFRITQKISRKNRTLLEKK